VTGFVSRPDRAGPSRPSLRLFVNGRTVRDRAITRAVAEAYRTATGGERPFEAFLFLEAPLHMVDVNVHPAKIEVRFAEPRTVWAAVQSAVRQALSQGTRVPPRAEAGRVREAVERYMAGAPTSATPGTGYDWRGTERARAGGGERSEEGADRGRTLVGLERPTLPFAAAPPTVLGQHRNTYIVASDGEDLLLVDQHTAHERVRFEGIVENLDRARVESQRLLAPSVVSLAPRLRPLLEEHAASLTALGFDVEPFGAGSVHVRAVPAVLGTRDPGPALTRLLQELLDREDTEWDVRSSRDRIAATLACHSAVRAGQALTAETMQAIVRDLVRAAHPTLCPHGRPTSVLIPRADVSRWFGRTGWRRQ
jgi:DNA mismatch repair protein MutL